MASLAKNTLYLYALTASNYLFGLATIPYVTRVLWPEVYGDLGFAMAIGAYFNLIIDFGFILSGTKRVANYSSNKEELSRIFSGITIIKLFFSVILFLLLSLLSTLIDEIRSTYELLSLFLLQAALSSILPDYLYRGLEDMKMITVRGVIVRAIFTALIFIFLKRPDQILLVPTFHILGAIIAFVWIYYDIKVRYNIQFKKPHFSLLTKMLSESFEYFLSRIASSIYNVTNTVILGLIYPGSAIVGYYASADKFRTLTSQGCSPVADSFYPYMIRTKNYNRLCKVTIYLEIPIILFCIIGFIWAKPICEFAFGNEFADSYILFRWMIPIIAITLPTYMFGFPALTPIGQSKWANRSVEIAMVNQLAGLLILFITNGITAVNLCILTLISEIISLSIRIIIFINSINQTTHKA